MTTAWTNPFVRSCRLLAMAVLINLAGCSALPTSGSTDVATRPSRDLRVATVLAAEGLKKLQQNQYEDASRIFNAGLKFSPDNARLHFLNGLTYHLLYLRGDETMLDLAVAGYELALSADPALYDAALQLGRLQFDAKHFRLSAAAFRHAANIEPQKGEAFLGLATAAYYAHDLEASRVAIDKAAPLLQGKAVAMRAAAIIHAALGDDALARADLDRYAGLEQKNSARAILEHRVDQWKLWHAAYGAPGRDEILGTVAAPLLAQNAPPSNPMPPTQDQPAPPADQAPGVGMPMQGQPGAPDGNGPEKRQPALEANDITVVDSDGNGPEKRQPALASWFDCGNSVGPGNAGGTSTPAPAGAAVAGDETTQLPALPVPCKDAGIPNMAVLDVVIVRTEDNSSSNLGINLLTGLTYVFNRSTQLTDTLTQLNGVDSRNVTITRQRSQGLPNPAGVAYSLNIANSTDSRSEILARPSLVALDRQASTFFSGRTLTVGLSGQAGGTSVLVDKPVGVSLSVTPTFVDSDSLLVAVRAARSFFEPIDSGGTFVQAMQTSRNSVTANVALKFGQTLILSGLTEQEVQRASNGVPVLQDIPLLQYLFRNKTTQNFTRSVLILITPRKPITDREETARTLSELEVWKDGSRRSLIPKIESQMKKDQDAASANMDSVYKHTLHNNLYLQFRSGDIAGDDWSQPSRLDAFFQQLTEILYY